MAVGCHAETDDAKIPTMLSQLSNTVYKLFENKIQRDLETIFINPIELLTDADLQPLFETERYMIEKIYDLPVLSYGDGVGAMGPSPVKGLNLEYTASSKEHFENIHRAMKPYRLVVEEAVFGVQPGEPLEKFRSHFGDIDIRTSAFYGGENKGWFFKVN